MSCSVFAYVSLSLLQTYDTTLYKVVSPEEISSANNTHVYYRVASPAYLDVTFFQRTYMSQYGYNVAHAVPNAVF